MAEQGKSRQHGMLLLIAAGLAQFIITADWWSVSVALPLMADDFHVRPIDLQWVLTGYVLTFCAFLGIAGPLGDRYGRKRFLLVGIVIFAGVSIWTALSTSALMVIVARIVQGIGAGLLFPLATAVVSDASSKDQLGRNIAILTGIAMLGAAMGPVLGGFLAEVLSWRWIFYTNVPVCAIAFFMVFFIASESKDPAKSGRLDVGGIILLILGISALSVGIDRIPHWQPWGLDRHDIRRNSSPGDLRLPRAEALFSNHRCSAVQESSISGLFNRRAAGQFCMVWSCLWSNASTTDRSGL